MNGVLGKMVKCSRCELNLFLQYKGKGELDGGYTTFNNFEDVPKDWLYGTEFGYLCPKCAHKFKQIVTKFFDGNVAPKWQIDEPSK